MGEALDLREAAEQFRLLTTPEETEQPVEEANQEPEVEGEQQGEDTSEPEQQSEDTEGAEEPQEEPIKSFAELAEHLEVDPDYLMDLLVEAKVDGEVKPVNLKEVLSSYQKSAAADKRLAEAAEARKAIESERKAELEKVNATLAIANQVLESQWQQLAEHEKSLASLKEDDPAEYASRMFDVQKAKENLQAQYNNLNSQYRQAMSEAQRKALEENAKRLPELIPEWADSTKATAEKQALTDYLSNQFTKEEISQVSDARFVALARKAMLFDQLKSQSKEAVRKVKTLPKRLAGGAKQSADAGKQAQLKKLQSEHRKSGSIASAVALYKARRGE